MEKKDFMHVQLVGSSYQIGRQIGEGLKSAPGGGAFLFPEVPGQTKEGAERLLALYEKISPGIRDEVQGCADLLGFPVERLVYIWATILSPGCSHVAVMPEKSVEGQTLVARNYDFTDKLSDMMLLTTRPEGRYGHIGFGVCTFGRSEGINEHGLCVTFSAAGVPVGNEPDLKSPNFEGVQFWVVLRGLLENCKTIDEAFGRLDKMPIAANCNFIISEPGGKSAIYTVFDGKRAVTAVAGKNYLHATNHVLQDELVQMEPEKLGQSVERYTMIKRRMEESGKIGMDELKALFGTEYPAGLACHAYDELFGTLQSMVFNLEERYVEVCFGSPVHNSWYRFDFTNREPFAVFPTIMERKSYGSEFWKMVE